MDLCRRINKKITKLTFPPIVIFTFHQISDEIDHRFEQNIDWNSITGFKKSVTAISNEYTIVSLSDAQNLLRSRRMRTKQYAAICFDDGYHSISNIKDFLLQKEIPFTIFINSAAIETKLPELSVATTWLNNRGIHINPHFEQNYISEYDRITRLADIPDTILQNVYINKHELFTEYVHPLISIGLHGHHHYDSARLTIREFKNNVQNCKEVLSCHPGYIPFFAYPYSSGNTATDQYLLDNNFTPLYCNFNYNLRNHVILDRVGLGGMNVWETRFIKNKE